METKKEKTRRRYTKEFKIEAVQLVQSREGQIKEVAGNLGIHYNILNRWVNEYNADPQESFPGNGKLKASDEEIYKLQKEIREIKEERDILKKALAIFSRAQK